MNLSIIIAIVAAVAVIVIISLVFTLKSDKRPNNVYIVGALASGKTKLFYHLVLHENLATITSMAENKTTLQVGKKFINLIDLPGHPRIRTQVLNSIKDARAIIFVIDSETILAKISDIANLLYDILSTKEIYKNKVPILIFGGKTDLHTARPIDLIREELEKEFQFIRTNRQQSDFVSSGNDSDFLFLGDENEDFNFDQLYTNKIIFSTGSVVNDSTQDVTAFLEKYV